MRAVAPRAVFFVLLALGFFSVFQGNSLHTANPDWFVPYQRESEALVISAMIERTHGEKSALGLGTYGYGTPGWMQRTYEAFEKGENPAVGLHPYVPQLGLQGHVFHWLASWLKSRDVSTYQALNSAAMALIMALFVSWSITEFGWRAGALLGAAIACSPWLVAISRNLYWMAWTWYLPMVAVAAVLWKQERSGEFRRSALLAAMFGTVALKSACGYEFLTTIVIAAFVPIVYFGIKHDRPRSQIARDVVLAGAASIAGFLAVLFIHALARPESFLLALKGIAWDAARRTHGGMENLPANLLESLRASPFDVASRYFLESNPPLLSIPHVHPIALLGAMLCTAVWATRRVESRTRALGFSFFMALLAPISWFFAAKGHSYFHPHVNFVLWSLPTLLVGSLCFGALWTHMFSTRRLLDGVDALVDRARQLAALRGASAQRRLTNPEDPRPVPSTRPRLPPLTSLRFIAAAMIVVGHAYPLFGKGAIALYIPLSQGVSFFFVLSGFVLAYNYPALPTRADVGRFLAARFARVWPLHAATCLMWIVLVSGDGGWARLVVNLLLLQAWIPYKDWALSFNGVSWSLSVEFFFYAMFPMLIMSWARRWHLLLAAEALVIACFVLVSQRLALPASDDFMGPGLLGVLYFNPLVRLLEFSVGIGIASLVCRFQATDASLTRTQWFLLEIVAILGVTFALIAAADLGGIRRSLGEAAGYYFMREGLWLFWGGIVLVFALSRGPLAALLRLPGAVFLGEISYALYLVHAMLIRYLEGYTAGLAMLGWAGYVAFWMGCLLLSSLLFLGVEKPARAAIMGFWDRRRSREGARGTGSKRGHLAAQHSGSAIALIAIVAGMIVFRPGTASVVDESQLGAFIQSPATVVVPGGGVFDEGLRVLGVQVRENGEDSVSLSILLRSEAQIAPQLILAVHLNDSEGKIIGAPGDRALDPSGKPIRAAQTWIADYPVKKELLQRAASIGLALYTTPDRLYKVSGTQTDWDGQRLILKLRR
jgi:peptidoglycan/LPS O-acetylase OafA/YrhL